MQSALIPSAICRSLQCILHCTRMQFACRENAICTPKISENRLTTWGYPFYSQFWASRKQGFGRMPHFLMLSSGQPTPCHTFLFGCLDSSATLCQTFVSVRLSCGRGSRAPSFPPSLLCPLRRETGSFKLNTRAEQRTGVLEAERRSENRGRTATGSTMDVG